MGINNADHRQQFQARCPNSLWEQGGKQNPNEHLEVDGRRWTVDRGQESGVTSQGLGVSELPAGNFELAAYPGLLVKDSYWRWPERNLSGNAIDFFMRVLGLSFHDAMRQIIGP